MCVVCDAGVTRNMRPVGGTRRLCRVCRAPIVATVRRLGAAGSPGHLSGRCSSAAAAGSAVLERGSSWKGALALEALELAVQQAGLEWRRSGRGALERWAVCAGEWHIMHMHTCMQSCTATCTCIFIHVRACVAHCTLWLSPLLHGAARCCTGRGVAVRLGVAGERGLCGAAAHGVFWVAAASGAWL